MPFPPTPSQTATNTPTPSITPSVTPSITPSLTECPSQQLITQGFYNSNSCGNFDLTAYTSYIRYNSVNYPLNQVDNGFGALQLYHCIPVRYPYIGLIYRFDFIIDPNLSLCNALQGYYYDRIDYEVISFNGIISGIPTYTMTERYYLNNTLVDTITPVILSVTSFMLDNCNMGLGGLYPQFQVQIPVTPTPSVTSTVTPSVTPTMNVTPTQTNTPSITPTNTPSPSVVSYIYAGTTNFWGSSALACANKTCGRPWYKSVPSWALGTTVYDDPGLTTPVNGGNNWIAVATSSTFCGGGWAAIQINAGGIIIGFVSCP